MGAWGSGLYSNDDAADFLPLVRSVLKLPHSVDTLVDILKRESTDEMGDETTFWLVLADQLEKKGVHHPTTTNAAIKILESGADLAEMRVAGADESDLKFRAKANVKLLERLKNPRAEKPRKTLKKPQPAAVTPGDYVCFPTQHGSARNPYFPPNTETFEQDGWGLVQITDVGWAFKYLSWVQLFPLTWHHKHPPTLDDARNAAPLSNLGFGTLSPAHFKRMHMQIIGNQTPRSDASPPGRFDRTPHYSAINDISISNNLTGL